MKYYNVPKQNRLPSDEAAQWRRFRRECKVDIDVLTALIAARAKYDRTSRATRVYSNMIAGLMAAYVSAGALERYRRGFTDGELNEISASGEEAIYAVTAAEAGMLESLDKLVHAPPGLWKDAHAHFIYCLFIRWQFVKLGGEPSVDALSANGANIAAG